MDASIEEQWARYGRALIATMSQVLEETPEDSHANLLEAADYWLSLGLMLGLHDPDRARRLLHLIEQHEAERGELQQDAATLIDEVFG